MADREGMMVNSQTFATAGWQLIPNCCSAAVTATLIAELEGLPSTGESGGKRNALGSAAVREWLRSSVVRGQIVPLLGARANAVRAIFFDKNQEANWRVPWHRDRLIAVRERIDVPGFASWSQKHGVWHVAPPRNIIDGMVAIRLHLDPVGANNGPLRLVPGSHRDAEEAPVDESSAVTVLAAQGSVLALRPWIRHASAPASQPTHRRILHVECAVGNLPGGLDWAEQFALVP